MRTYFEYRAAARETLEGRWNETALMTLIIIAIPALLGVSTVCFPFMGLDEMSSIVMNSSVNGLTTLVSILVIVPLECAMYNVFVSMIRGTMENDTPVKEMFVFFKQDWVRYVKTYILEMIIIFLISLITLGIGGIIFSYAYAMVPYLLHDYPELGAREALRMSRELMKGHKWDLFVLQLTFLGWIILAILTCGIGLLWLTPYMSAAQGHFYQDLKDELIEEE